MPTVRRRPTATAKPPVSRRRDRAEETDEEEEDEVEATSRPAPARRAKKTTTRVKRAPAKSEPEEDEDDEEWEDPDEEEEEAEDEEEDEDEEEEAPPPRRKKAAATKKAAPRRRPVEDDDEEEEPAPRRRSTKSRTSTKSKLPPGVAVGRQGVEKIRKEGGDGAMRLTLTGEFELIKFLEPENFVTFRQHWVSQGGNAGNRPYTCPGRDDCPLCDLGDRANQVISYNVLHLSAPDGPKNMVLNLGKKADDALWDAATSKRTGKQDIEKDFFTASKSGKQQASQTNFRPIKVEDIEEDWEEILENFDIEDLDAIIEEARKNVYDVNAVVQVTPPKQLLEVAKYLSDED